MANTVAVEETFACDVCEGVSSRTVNKMKLVDFQKLMQENPDEYWVDKKSTGDVYRHHETSRKYRHRSC